MSDDWYLDPPQMERERLAGEADPIVPDEAVEAFVRTFAPFITDDGTPMWETARAALAAAVPALTAAARTEVAASVLAVADVMESFWARGPVGPKHFRQAVDRIRAAVSDEGVEAHERRLRAEAWDEGNLSGGYWGTTQEYPVDVDPPSQNPYRAEVGDQLNQEGDG